MRSHVAVRAAAAATFALFALTACSAALDDAPAPEAPSSAAPSTAAPASEATSSPASPSSGASDLPEGVENPENRPLVVVPADQTEVTVPVGTMLYFDVTKDTGWTTSSDSDAVEMEDVFLEGTMEDNPYWGMYRAVKPGTATISITFLNQDGSIGEEAVEYRISVE